MGTSGWGVTGVCGCAGGIVSGFWGTNGFGSGIGGNSGLPGISVGINISFSFLNDLLYIQEDAQKTMPIGKINERYYTATAAVSTGATSALVRFL